MLMCHKFVCADTVVSQFSLRSSLRNIDFGIVVNAFNFYDCAVPNRWGLLEHDSCFALFSSVQLTIVCVYGVQLCAANHHFMFAALGSVQ